MSRNTEFEDLLSIYTAAVQKYEQAYALNCSGEEEAENEAKVMRARKALIAYVNGEYDKQMAAKGELALLKMERS